MNVLFGYQDFLEVVKNSVNPCVEGATDAQRNSHKKKKTKDLRRLVIAHPQRKLGKFWRKVMQELIKQRW